jgi:peptidoglycan/LPS O-acetylase OafA/YrhL
VVAGAPPSEVRDPRLDGLRGFAIALVLLFHATRFGVEATPWQRAALELPALGWSGVDLFFVLSGFLITGILLRTRRSTSYASTFYARRALRIFPLYYAVLIFWIVLAPRIAIESGGQLRPLGAPVADPFWYWTYLTNIGVIVRGSTHLLDVTWSLAIEEHFYLLWPWVVWRASDRGLLRVCGFTIAGALALRIASFVFDAPRDTAYMFTLCRFDTLATGAAIAVLAAQPHGLGRFARAAPIGLAASAVLLAALLGAIGAWGGADGAIARSQHPWMQTVGFTLLCVGWGALLVWLVTAPARSRMARVFELRPLGSLGRYSYAIYLVHLPVALGAQQWLGGLYGRHFGAAQLAAIALTTAISYGIARTTWALLEAPLLRQKRRFPYRVAD